MPPCFNYQDASYTLISSKYAPGILRCAICGLQVRRKRVDLGTALQAYEQPRSFPAKSSLLGNTSSSAHQSTVEWETELEEAVAAADANQQAARAALAHAVRYASIMRCSFSWLLHQHTGALIRLHSTWCLTKPWVTRCTVMHLWHKYGARLQWCHR